MPPTSELAIANSRSTLAEEIRCVTDATDAATYASILRKCCVEKSLEQARLAHSKLRKSEHRDSRFIQNLLVEMYGKCGSTQDASLVFESMRERNVVSWNVMVSAMAKNKQHAQAIEVFRRMLLDGTRPHKVTYLSALDACSGLSVDIGRQIHRLINESGCDQDLAVANSVINMYGRCGGIDDAKIVFSSMEVRDVVSWNSFLSAYARNGYSIRVLGLFEEMDVKPDKVTYLAVLDACATMAALQRGKEIHHRIAVEDEQLLSDTMLGNSLLNMYGKCHSVDDAAKVFESMDGRRRVVTWTGMISVYAQNSHGWDALRLFREMDQEGVKANVVTFVTILDACADVGALEKGRELHARIVQAGLSSSVILGNSVMNMYTKCGSLEDARSLFEILLHDNVVAWNTLMTMFVKHEKFSDVLHLLCKMDNEGLRPDEITYLNVVSSLETPNTPLFERVFARIVSDGLESNLFVGHALVSLHCRSGNLEQARKIFDLVERRGVVAWTAMLCGYAERGLGREALHLLREMDLEGIKPDSVTFIGAVDACASLPCLTRGRNIHQRIERIYGSQLDTNLGNALVNMYGKCGNLVLARGTFQLMRKDLVSWNAMIAAYAHNGHGSETVELLLELSLEGIEPDHITLLGVIFGCGNAGLLEDGLEYLTRMYDDYGLIPQMNHYGCMVDLLGKAGWLEQAKTLIDHMPVQADAIAWQALLGACNTHGEVKLGSRVATQVVEMAPRGTSTYVLLSNIYSGVRK
ncbi:pentatricopeptide repeat-containing protein At3g09040, mitochondrial [Selaginella moellendorffii]|uniref:pentatricopeptide repeat-containing protein At3g09040, mitochondrial n=1 Tax=Selaginella moellendorffii TaxID=88036 RepID=UPI000D1CA83A|nr:pentatricopeptide repeat-containing protein At3g09040, mitochondrial [Selaginella moellendorffii]|eukprot:XP_024519419.1 pentatricopeptide repeat-containing protein At3g09040, mitochondrial [Selaginella moellendorffii]